MSRMPSLCKTDYLRSLGEHAINFAASKVRQENKNFFCDQTPWNLLIAEELQHIFPDALFVLMLRHFSGTIQSLQRSYAEGYSWAGKSIEERAHLWATFYRKSMRLPPKRTIAVSYDLLCREPQKTVEHLEFQLARLLKLDPDSFDRHVLCKSHATSHARSTIAQELDETIAFTSIPSVDASRWSQVECNIVEPYLGEVDQALRMRFATYEDPTCSEFGCT